MMTTNIREGPASGGKIFKKICYINRNKESDPRQEVGIFTLQEKRSQTAKGERGS
jgi:hypothetical protein